MTGVLTPLKDSWVYPHGDPSIRLFDEAVRRWGLALPQGASVLELGCAETDFHEWLCRARPDIACLDGVDVNPIGGYRGFFWQTPAESIRFNSWKAKYDAVIALGAIEHFGLGFYGDPVNESADLETVALVESWLKPGGWFYCDVPWTPETHYVTENRHFRVYDDTTLQTRLTGGLVPKHRAFASGDKDVWQDARPSSPMVPFWYAIQLSEKAA